ncbi:Hypothetical protein AKI40_2577 [Enterobacter sp. FY-07]|nr:Hypothetical protein AKI40_2577 [Enterobacter sp. FY-07]
MIILQRPEIKVAELINNEAIMRQVFHYVINNVREHLMIYIVLWLLVTAIDIIYIVWLD